MYSTRYSTYQSSPYYSTSYDYQTSPVSPNAGSYYYTYTATPGKSSSHKRRATADGYAYASPQGQYYYPEDAKPKRSHSHRHPEYVSGDRRRGKTTRQTYVYTEASGKPQYRSGDAYHTFTSKSPHHAHTGRHADSRGADYGATYERKYRTSPPPYDREQYAYGDQADPYAYHAQIPVYAEATPKTRPKRSASYSHKQPPPRPRADPLGPTRAANDADARRAGIPAGFSLKHWDPTEEPILLLGSVFDANSLGKWIYDWTVATHGAGAPITEIAGDLWLLLIDLAGKIKRAEGRVGRVRNTEDKELIDDFLESGERLWQRFSKLLKVCETYMLKAAKKEKSSKKVVVGKNSGVEFVRCIFGRDKEMEKTEKVMTGIRLWSMRFDANCDEILRYA
ncbi:hypothetical protein CAC42_6258 [Sphaceloma murrayae]|uniref:Vegetative cell wall protein gp1 n=1 Tax=Sphaceloma murrayae TaxID=2082308 RepID=A0A2K1QTT1_9PEZI|nr:hypothetical protein CAC42_6258 [Sphaceloma murrayae]